ncbi:MAG TPA: type VI secretion system protein TssA [Longimicrobiaceae bacterium]
MPLRSDLLVPLAGANPAGVNVRYEPVFDQIKIARIEEPVLPQGEWQRERKTADYARVVELAGDVLATRSKDLQVAAWLVEALTRREGFAGLRSGLELLRTLIEGFWDGLYPELEDGDAEMRAAPLEWVGQNQAMLDAVRNAPLDPAGHGFFAYRQSRELGHEADVRGDEARHRAWREAVEAGKVSADAFEASFRGAPKEWYRALAADLEGSLAELDALDRACEARFSRDVAPGFRTLREAVEEVRQTAGQLLAKKLAEPDPPGSEPDPAPAGPGPGPEAPAAEAAEAPRSPEGGEALARRVAALRARDPHRAVELLMQAAAQERSVRARFLRRSEAAEVMLEAGLASVAMPVLRELLEQVEAHRLEQWEEGETVARTLGLAYRCMEKLEPGNTSGREALYLRICRLDPMRAITLASAAANDGSGS